MSIQDFLGKPKPEPMDAWLRQNVPERIEEKEGEAPEASPGAIVTRMMTLIARQIAALERKIEKDGLMSENELRQLEAMSKTMEKLIALDKASVKAAPERARMDPELAHIRDRLIERVRALETK